jgi:predicted nucleic acid-binding protein
VSDVYVLDACALLAVLKGEPGGFVVRELFQKANSGEVALIMNRVNLFEVYYGFFRESGKAFADNILDNVKKSVLSVCEFDERIFEEAGRIKAVYRLSVADSIVIAQASVSGGVLLTSDHHEMDIVEQNENIAFSWIR